MNKKVMLWMMMTVLFAMIVSALPIESCGYSKEINKNCTIITPELQSCGTYNYDIKNVSSSGTVIQSGTLTSIGDDIYAFNFTMPEGDYVIKLCDGSTREIKVKLEDDTMLGIIIVLLGVIGVFAYFSINFDDKNTIFMWMKLMFFGLALFFLVVLISFGKLMLEDSGGSVKMLSLLSTSYMTSVIIAFLSMALIFVALLVYTLKGFSDVGKKKDVEMYGKV